MAWTGSTPDASKPNAARVYDYLLGGRDHFAADRELADRLEAQAGDGASVRELAGINRRFVLAATTRAVSLGIGQIADLGAGTAREPSVHATARASGYPVRVAYVDRDAMVLSHLSALCRGDGLAVAEGDVSDPGPVLDGLARSGVIDLDEPVLILLGGTLSAMEPGVARDAVAGYAKALVPGSRVAISCASYRDPETGALMEAMSGAAGTWHNHSPADIGSFFEAGRLELTAAGGAVTDLRCWPVVAGRQRDAAVIGGVGVRP